MDCVDLRGVCCSVVNLENLGQSNKRERLASENKRSDKSLGYFCLSKTSHSFPMLCEGLPIAEQ